MNEALVLLHVLCDTKKKLSPPEPDILYEINVLFFFYFLDLPTGLDSLKVYKNSTSKYHGVLNKDIYSSGQFSAELYPRGRNASQRTFSMLQIFWPHNDLQMGC